VKCAHNREVITAISHDSSPKQRHFVPRVYTDICIDGINRSVTREFHIGPCITLPYVKFKLNFIAFLIIHKNACLPD